MDFGRYNQAEQAQIAQMIEHKQVNTSCWTVPTKYNSYNLPGYTLKC